MKPPPFKMITESEMEIYRFRTFWDKEPETIEWIQSFKNGETFCDVGANIGIYSLYCAVLHPNSLIYAIEPDRRNYARLLQNIILNGFKNILPFNFALHEFTGTQNFYVPKIETGASGGQVEGGAYGMSDHAEVHKIPVLDFEDFIGAFNISMPNHIKIDVDGQETWILNSILKARISDFEIKSLLVEFNGDDGWHQGELAKRGFTTDNRFNRMENHSRIRRAREGIQAENVIFTRTG